MPIYRYVKASQTPSVTLDYRPRLLSFTAYTLIGVGIFLISNAVFPLLTYRIFTAQEFQPPVKTHSVVVSSPQVLSETSKDSLDLANAGNWFPQATPDSAPSLLLGHTPGNIEFYSLTIPKLKIKNAIVSVGSTDLSQSLIHYSGTALPGQLGNPVIFGHSVLPQFFNPKNYISIFSTLHTLETGDTIVTNFDGVEYRYSVTDKFEVKPTDLYVLNQTYNQREISLITCSPPGTYLRRLVVKAKLRDNNFL